MEQFCNYLIFLEGSDDKKSSKGIEAKEQGTEPSEEIQGSSGKRRFHGTKHLTATQNLGSMHHGSSYENLY